MVGQALPVHSVKSVKSVPNSLFLKFPLTDVAGRCMLCTSRGHLICLCVESSMASPASTVLCVILYIVRLRGARSDQGSEMLGGSERRLNAMRTTKEMAMAILLLVLVEALYVHIDGGSWRAGAGTRFLFGFPFRSVTYGTATGEKEPVPQTESEVGLEADPILLASDATVALLLGFVLIQFVSTAALVSVVEGCVLGSVTGSTLSWLSEVSPESWVSGVVAVVVALALVPIAIYIFSLGHKRQKTIIMVISAVTVSAFCRSFFLVDGLFDGFMESDALLDLSIVPRVGAVSVVPVCECFLIMLLHKKVFPESWRKKQFNYARSGTEQESVAEITCNSDQRDSGTVVRRLASYMVLLAMPMYIGFHFWTLREMRNDPFCLSDAIWSELERREISLDSWHTESWPESPEIGWNASFVVEIAGNSTGTYYAHVSKHILIPWIQVSIEQTETAAEGNETQGPNQE